jgi:hypothetical protein
MHFLKFVVTLAAVVSFTNAAPISNNRERDILLVRQARRDAVLVSQINWLHFQAAFNNDLLAPCCGQRSFCTRYFQPPAPVRSFGGGG